jgi:tetratricopeptide (TPR) repeat protein
LYFLSPSPYEQARLGGDAWDTKIRGQIGSCALFVPVISGSTQARLEGYFRLEWKIAAQRTHTMADERVFLLPVVIDSTRDAEASVPAEFKNVQWTSLPPGETPPVFVTRVKRLLEGGSAPVTPRQDGSTAPIATPGLKTAKWLALSIVFAALAVSLLLWRPWEDATPGQPESKRPPAVPTPGNGSMSDAQKLVEQARQVYEQGDELNRDSLFLAEEMVQRAIALDPSEPSAWELATWLSYVMIWHAIDDTQARRETLLRQANSAIALAPDAVAARWVFATAQLVGPNISQIQFAELESGLKQLAERDPQNWKIQRSLGIVAWLTGRIDDAVGACNRAIELSHGHPMVTADLVNVLIRNNRYAEAETLLARALAQHRSGRLLAFDLIVTSRWRGDLENAVEDIANWPGWLLQQDRGMSVAWQTALWARRPDLALRLVQQFPRQYVRDITFSGPRGVLSARAHEMAGNTAAAQANWRATLQQCDLDLAANASDVIALYWRAWALARLGDQAGAQSAATLLRQGLQTAQSNYIGSYNAASLWATVGWTDAAISSLQTEIQNPSGFITLTRAHLELEPAFDPIRNDPRFRELVVSAPSPR